MTNQIQFKDFHPEVIETSFWKGKKYESIEMVLDRVNQWIRKNYNREIINVETIQAFTGHTQKSSTPYKPVVTGGGHMFTVQFIRLWYK